MLAWICARLNHLIVLEQGPGACKCHCLCNAYSIWLATHLYERSWLTRDEAFRLIHNTKTWGEYTRQKERQS